VPREHRYGLGSIGGSKGWEVQLYFDYGDTAPTPLEPCYDEGQDLQLSRRDLLSVDINLALRTALERSQR